MFTVDSSGRRALKERWLCRGCRCRRKTIASRASSNPLAIDIAFPHFNARSHQRAGHLHGIVLAIPALFACVSNHCPCKIAIVRRNNCLGWMVHAMKSAIINRRSIVETALQPVNFWTIFFVSHAIFCLLCCGFSCDIGDAGKSMSRRWPNVSHVRPWPAIRTYSRRAA